MAKKNKMEDIDIGAEIEYTGNWNRKNGEYVSGKAICISRIGKDKIVFTHDELLNLIGKHIEADNYNIKMINDSEIDTGVITKAEVSFRNKLDQYLQTGLDAWM
jgi:predicted nuclease of restriction endonuclease-like RecB superfamily